MNESARGTELDPAVLLARAFLSRVVEPACIPAWSLVRELGPVEAARQLRDGVREVAGVTPERTATADPRADLEAAARHGVRLVVPESPDWPHFAFACLERAAVARDEVYRRSPGHRTHAEHGEPIPPLALWVRGDLPLVELAVRSVGIVGARAATRYGEQVTADLAYGLARRGFVVVSGGAHGIDGAAHRAALAAGGPTVLVSAGGLDRAYPPAHDRLFARVAESGLLISESPPGAAPQRRRFLTRNRLIVALSTGLVVIEAARRSGALNTAGHCGRLGRPLMAVPGPVTSAMSVGCHALLAREVDPAILVTGIADVLPVIGTLSELAELGSAPGDGPRATHSPAAEPGNAVRDALDRLDGLARQIFDGFPSARAALPEEIAAASGVTPLDVIRTLSSLESVGLVEPAGDGTYRIAATARSRAPRR